MKSNTITEYLNKKAIAAWLWFTTLFAYLVSIILPIIGANVEKWLKPLLVKIEAPEFLRSDFTVYATVFGVFGVLTTKAIKALVTADERYKSEDAAKIRAIRKDNRRLRDENKKLTSDNLALSDQHKEDLRTKKVEWEQSKKEELDLVKEANSEVMKKTVEDYEREKRRMQECIKIQELAMDAMKNYKSIEQDIQEYNASSTRRKYHRDD